MARTVESSVSRALEALFRAMGYRQRGISSQSRASTKWKLSSTIMPCAASAAGNLPEDEVRHIVATLKINNDLERMGDLAVNICQRVISLPNAGCGDAGRTGADGISVRAMVSRCLGALQSIGTSRSQTKSSKAKRRLMISRPSLRPFILGYEARLSSLLAAMCSTCWPRETWSASPTTPRTLPKTSSSGCAASTSVTIDLTHLISIAESPPPSSCNRTFICSLSSVQVHLAHSPDPRSRS